MASTNEERDAIETRRFPVESVSRSVTLLARLARSDSQSNRCRVARCSQWNRLGVVLYRFDWERGPTRRSWRRLSRQYRRLIDRRLQHIGRDAAAVR